MTEKAINPGAVFPSLSRLTTDTFSIKIPLNDASKRRWNDIIADNAWLIIPSNYVALIYFTFSLRDGVTASMIHPFRVI